MATNDASTTNRLAVTFASCQTANRAALIGYLTAFDPDEEQSFERLCAACEGGLDVLELGVPFSDPTADGPVIQEAMVRALQSGATLDGVLRLAGRLRDRFADLPIVLFGYANPLLRRPIATVVELLENAGIDGLLVVDLPPEHNVELRQAAAARGISWVGLCAPTTPPARAARVMADATGFVYGVSLTGVTGSALDTNSPELRTYIDGLRTHAQTPVAIGFGIKHAEQVRALAPMVDGIVVGSELVRASLRSSDDLRAKVRELANACRRGD